MKCNNTGAHLRSDQDVSNISGRMQRSEGQGRGICHSNANQFTEGVMQGPGDKNKPCFMIQLFIESCKESKTTIFCFNITKSITGVPLTAVRGGGGRLIQEDSSGGQPINAVPLRAVPMVFKGKDVVDSVSTELALSTGMYNL